MKIFINLTVSIFVLIILAMPLSAQKKMEIAAVLQPGKSPVVTFRLQFLTGSANDPKGKEGLAALTAAMIAQGGSKDLAYEKIVEQFYPMATDFSVETDKEMTTFVGTTHTDNLDKYYNLINQMLLQPGFREEDFKRLKDQALNFLKVNLRQSNDEELGKEQLYNIIYAGTPYGHHSTGTVSGLENITLQDLKDFYAKNYTQSNLVIGLAGGYDAKFLNQLKTDFAKLPAGEKSAAKMPLPKLETGTRIDIVQRETRATAMSLGFPIDVNRGSKDYAALALVASYFGQHRSSNSHLYGEIREKRGLNYGDYAYIEYFPRGMFQFEPSPNLARKQQIFQIWIRPVEPQNANFTLRAALYEYDKLIKNGMSQADFDATKQFLSKYVNVLTQTKSEELGYALDSRFYGIGEFGEVIKTQLAKLTLEDVNNAIKSHLKSDAMRIVLVTKDAENLKKEITENKTGTVAYASPKPAAILAEDKIIGTFPFSVKAENITVTPVEKVFQ